MQEQERRELKISYAVFFIVGIASILGCGTAISNPCDQFSQNQFLEMKYSPLINGNYVEIDEHDKLTIARVLKSPPRQFRGTGDPAPMGYLMIQEDVFKIGASVDYISGGNFLRWGEGTLIGEIAIKLHSEYSEKTQRAELGAARPKFSGQNQ